MFELWGCRRWWHLVHLVWAVAVKVWIGSHVCCECLPTTMLVWWVCAESQTQRALLIRILLTSTVTSVQQSAHHPSGVVSHRARSLTRGGGSLLAAGSPFWCTAVTSSFWDWNSALMWLQRSLTCTHTSLLIYWTGKAVLGLVVDKSWLSSAPLDKNQVMWAREVAL